MSEPCRFVYHGQPVCMTHPPLVDEEGIKTFYGRANICNIGLATLRAELQETYERLEAVLLERPYKDGNYTHLPYCNTSPKNVPGTPGVTCNCRVGAALRAKLEAQARVMAGLQQPAITPVFQTTFGEGTDGSVPGNCFAACIATIVGKPITEVPNFIIESEWVTAAQSWLASHGWGLVQMPWPETVYKGQFPEAYVVVSGWGCRGLRHSVVGKVVRRDDGYPHVELVHDPHPDGGGLDTKRREQYVTFLFRINTQALSPKEA